MKKPNRRANLTPGNIAAVWEQITEIEERVLAVLFDMLFPENPA